MTWLRGQDFRLLLKFLKDNYAFLDHEAFVAGLLINLSQVIRSELTSYSEMNPVNGNTKDLAGRPEICTPRWISLWKNVFPEHPVLMHMLKTGDGHACRISDVISGRQLRSLALYNEFYRPLSIEHGINVGLSATPTQVIGIGFHRSRRDFSERERLLLNLLRPHLIQGYRNAKAITRFQTEYTQIEWALDKVGRGVIVLGEDERILMANASARQWMADYFGSLSGQGDHLPEDMERWVRQQKILYEEREQIPPPLGPLVEVREDKRLIVRLVTDSDQRLLLLEEERMALRPESLLSLGLTQRETGVLAWLAQGKTNGEIAFILGVSQRTVEKHVERIYQKLGVETRIAAISRIKEFVSAGKGTYP